MTLPVQALIYLFVGAFWLGVSTVFGGIAVVAHIHKDKSAQTIFEIVMILSFLLAVALLIGAAPR